MQFILVNKSAFFCRHNFVMQKNPRNFYGKPKLLNKDETVYSGSTRLLAIPVLPVQG